MPGALGAKSSDVAVWRVVTTLADENTSFVHAGSLNSLNTTVPAATRAPKRVAVSRTTVPTGPPGDALPRRMGLALRMTMVKVWHAGVATPLLAQTVVGPKVPAVVGSPITIPFGLKVNPGGSEPLVTANVAAGSTVVLLNW